MTVLGWAGRRVAVTGGSGFIGSHLRAALTRLGADVSNVDLVESPDLDITKQDVFGNSRFDLIFHLAAVSSIAVCESNPWAASRVNVHGTLNVLQFASRNNIGLVFPSSLQVYGQPDFLPVDETHAVRPTHVYALTKALCESICNFYRGNRAVSISVLRFGNVYGPNQSIDFVVPKMISQALTNHHMTVWNSKPSRDFVFIEDAVQALLLAGEKVPAGLLRPTCQGNIEDVGAV